MTIAYVDMDILIHRAIHGASQEVDDGEYLVSHSGIKDAIVEGCAKWVAPIKASTVIPVLSDFSHNWRYALKGPYKLNRGGGGKGASVDLMKFARQFVRDHWKDTLQIEGLEADDTIGIMCTHPNHTKRSVAVSIDKDMLTLPARVFNPSKGGRRAMKVHKAVADYNWLTQAVTGDTVDGYKGIPGVGPKGAEKLLKQHVGDVWGMWAEVAKAYLDNDLTLADALLNARYARILRHEDWDADKKRIRLFTGTKKVKWLKVNTKTMARPEVAK